MYTPRIIKSKNDAQQIINSLTPERGREGGVRFYDPYANGCGGTVWVWVDDEGDFWTFAQGRGWWDQGNTQLSRQSAINMLYRDRKFWNASERERQTDMYGYPV